VALREQKGWEGEGKKERVEILAPQDLGREG